MVSTIGTSDAPLIGFAGGGTGGHLYPALAVVEALRRQLPHARFVFFGTDRPIDQQIIRQAGYDLVKQSLSPLSPAPWRWPNILRRYRASKWLCHKRFHRDAPTMLIGTGGLGSVPPMRLALKMGIPTALLNPDALPGRANRYLAKRANIVFTQWETSTKFLPASANIRLTGCPVREAFQTNPIPDAHERFNLDPNKKTLLVTGASQGARTINQAVIALLDDLPSMPQWQVLHLAGQLDYESVTKAYADRAIQSCVLPFTHQMPAAMSIASLVVSRAGASTLSELATMGCPSLLFPYPFHKDMHQLANAEMMAKNGASMVIKDMKNATQNASALRKILLPLLRDENQLEHMASAAREVARPEAAATIASEMISLAYGRRVKTTSESMEPDFCLGR